MESFEIDVINEVLTFLHKRVNKPKRYSRENPIKFIPELESLFEPLNNWEIVGR